MRVDYFDEWLFFLVCEVGHVYLVYNLLSRFASKRKRGQLSADMVNIFSLGCHLDGDCLAVFFNCLT